MRRAQQQAAEPTSPRRKPRPADQLQRRIYVNHELWRATHALAARQHRTLSGLICHLLERELGWTDADAE